MSDWNRQYVDALLQYVSTGDESDLVAAYELGRTLLQEGSGLTNVAYAHWDGFQDLLTQRVSASYDTLKKSRDFLVESLAPLEMGLRGFREANVTLRQLNTDLEELVSARTEDLERTNAELEALLGAVPVGLLLVTPNRELRWLNETRAAELQVDDRDSVVREPLSRFAPGVDIGAIETAFGGEPVDLGDVDAPCGRILEVKYRPVRKQGTIVGVLEVTRDVTEQRKAAAERQEIARRLEASQRMEAIGRLAGGIAHDFNNLLTVIGTYAALLEDHVPEGEPSEDLKLIRDASDRAARLTRQLLTFSRRQPQELRVMDLGTVIRNLENMFERVLAEDIELSVRAPQQPLPVQADLSQLEQVLMNLVVNARDAMPDGGSLRVGAERTQVEPGQKTSFGEEVPAGTYATLWVTDTGEGMDAETAAHIFEPFFTTKSETKGTGLGLATVYGIVKQSGGFIFVDSEPQHGTSFRIYLPITTHTTLVSEREEPADLRGTETVLLVEDDEMVRHATRRILERNGYHVISTSTAEEALEIVESNEPIDVLLTDVVMPGMHGPELIREVRQVRPGLGIVAASGYTDTALSRRGLDQVELLVAKPFTEAKLLSVLRQAIDGSRRDD